jgi:hypothetical protein
MRVYRRVADEDIDPTPCFARLSDKVFELCLIGNSRSDSNRLTAFSTDLTATSSHGAALRAEMTTRPPASANASAIARPIPRLEPVMIATFPDRSNSLMTPLPRTIWMDIDHVGSFGFSEEAPAAPDGGRPPQSQHSVIVKKLSCSIKYHF